MTERLERKRAKDPYQPKFYAAITKEKTLEMEMKGVIKDMIIYFAYLAIIIIICYGSRDSNAFRQKTAIEKAVIHAGMNCEILPTGDTC